MTVVRRGLNDVRSEENLIVLKKLVSSMVDVGRVVRAASYSFAGLRAAIRNEAAFRQELALFVVLAPVGAWLGHDSIERVLLIGSLLLVLIVELLNSAVEATVDRIGKDQHRLSGRAKDMSSAAVLLSLMLATLTWALILTGARG